jgi:nucleoside-diphosphate-sugar epimerase
LIKATSRQRFMAVNHEGAVRVAQAAQRLAPGAHFMMVSSLAAREPMLSDYAASKRAGEQAVLALLGARATVVRPPAVYGPGDRETLLFFKLAERRIVPLLGAPDARAAMIHVRDLSDLIVRLLGQAPDGRTVTAADERLEGYGWKEILSTAAAAVGNPGPGFVQAPMAVLRSLACVGDIARVFGSASMLNSQKLRELRHRDWSVSADEHAVPRGWAPALSLREGFSDTVAWYRQAGWLSAARGATPSA